MDTYNMKDEIRKTAYLKYQLNWMSMHGYGLDDIISRLNDLEKDEPNRDVGQFKLPLTRIERYKHFIRNGNIMLDLMVNYGPVMMNSYQVNTKTGLI